MYTKKAVATIVATQLQIERLLATQDHDDDIQQRLEWIAADLSRVGEMMLERGDTA